jgi:hypothetical protein
MPTKSFIADAKSRNAIAILVWLSFVGMASPALAQGPLPIPSGPSAILPLPGPPARITVHPRPHLHRHCIRWYVVQHRPLFRPDIVQYFRVPFPTSARSWNQARPRERRSDSHAQHQRYPSRRPQHASVMRRSMAR